jgi:hypothetical protein
MNSKDINDLYGCFEYDMNLTNNDRFISWEKETRTSGIDPSALFETVLKNSKIKISCPKCKALTFDFFVMDFLGIFQRDKKFHRRIKKGSNDVRCKMCKFDISNKKEMERLHQKERDSR